MSHKLSKFFVDFSPFDMEIITKIPIDKLVNIICNFYWDIGHKSIKIIRNPSDLETYIDYSPDKKFEKLDEIRKISVATYKKKENKQKFDSVIIHFEEDKSNKTKILWETSFGFKTWNTIYIIIAFFIGLDFAGKQHTTGLMAMFLLLLIPLYLAISFRIKRIEKHPSVKKCKKEFEELIRKKERELFPDDY
ncbi:hypothetical protein ACSAZL_08320 [Methanosarcina sp. T3]|uniref:hypothetical protein n=1 Tax=Methanosarcina sp. T3 TaxID=3439062 RepID=UPI003F861C89